VERLPGSVLDHSKHVALCIDLNTEDAAQERQPEHLLPLSGAIYFNAVQDG
jgi:hypothetical protein